MKVWKKLSAVALALVMVMALCVPAFAEGTTPTSTELANGEVGGYTNETKDKPTSQTKVINIQKELTAYNVDESTINAPTVSYTYAIAAGAANINVTDATTDHTNGTAVTVKTKAGVTTGVTLTGQGQTSGTATIAWAPTETIHAASTGEPNYKTLSIDFSNVVFGAVGVYRYKITETPPSYAASGVTATTETDATAHVRYLDVYVRANPGGVDTDNNGSLDQATDWDIYGYVCMVESEEITPDGDTTIAGAVKTNGFVAGTNDGTTYKADSYYTFNVEVSKTVQNDNYAKATHSFPFTVIFTNTAVTQAVDIIGKVTGTASEWTEPASSAMSGNSDNSLIKGVVKIHDGGAVKYVGIPCGTSVEVYETNDMAGVTYQVTTTVDGEAQPVDQAVTDATAAPTTAVAQITKAVYESSKATITTTIDTNDEDAHTIAITNNLQLISPTGVTLRYAPYLAMMGAGIVALPLSLRKKEELD